MSTWTDAEDADSWAAEQARVAEWASQHEHPVTVALRQRDQAMGTLCALLGVDTTHRDWVNFQEVHAAAHRLLGRLEKAETDVADLTQRLGQIRVQTLREVEEKGQFIYEVDHVCDEGQAVTPVIHARRLLLDGVSPW